MALAPVRVRFGACNRHRGCGDNTRPRNRPHDPGFTLKLYAKDARDDATFVQRARPRRTRRSRPVSQASQALVSFRCLLVAAAVSLARVQKTA